MYQEPHVFSQQFEINKFQLRLIGLSLPLNHETITKRYQTGNAGAVCSEKTPGKRGINGRNREIDFDKCTFTSAWDQDHDRR